MFINNKTVMYFPAYHQFTIAATKGGRLHNVITVGALYKQLARFKKDETWLIAKQNSRKAQIIVRNYKWK